MMRIALGLVVLAACGVENSQYRLRYAIDAQRGAFDRCYEDTLATDPSAEGTMRLLVRVPSSSGRIDHVEISRDAQIADPYLHDCVRGVLQGLSIGDAPTTDDLYVEYTLRFRPS